MNSASKSEALTSLSALVASHFDDLWSLWSQMDLDPSPLQDRIGIVEHQLRRNLSGMVREEEGYIAKMADLIEGHAKERMKLARELGTTVKDPDPDLGLIKLEKELRHQLNQLRVAKEQRMVQVLDLKREDELLCRGMEIEPFAISATAIPTDAQMVALQAHIHEMTTVKSQRMGMFSEMKLAIIDLLERLEAEPDTTFERTLVCESDATFILSSSNLQTVKDVLRRLEDRMEANRRQAEALRQKIFSLIRKLGQEEAERQRIELELNGSGPSEIKELERILAELEVLKVEKMEHFIKATRVELVELWDKCYYSQAQRDKFQPFLSTHYHEDLLNEHERQVDILGRYFEANRDIFAKVAKRQDLWKKMLELEAKQKDPDHLLKARGNTLLLEERDRKRVNRQLPKIEDELMEDLAQYLELNGRPFLVGGVSYEDFVDHQVSEHNRLAEDEKQAKLQARKQQNFHETIYGSKPMTPANRATKRKAGGLTPVNESKRYRPQADLTVKSSASKRSPYMGSSSKKSAHSSRYGLRPQAQRKILGDRNDTIVAGHSSATKRAIPSNSTITSVDSDNFFRDIPHSALTSTFQYTPESVRKIHTPSSYARSTASSRATKAAAAGTPNKSVFKTPSSRALTPGARSSARKLSTLRSGSSRPVPFLI